MKGLLAILILPALIVIGCGAQEKSENKEGAAQDTGANSALKTDPKPQMDSEVVARVNGVPIYKDELNGRPVKELVSEEVIYQKGLGMGIDEKYAQKLRDYRKQLVVHEMKGDILEELPPAKQISDEEILSYYEANPKKYTFVRMQEVGFADKDLGDEIVGKMKGGEDLTEIVNSYTESGANVVGRDLGYSREMLKLFDTVELGAVTDVITKPDGSYSVVKIVEIKPIPLTQSERAIRRLLEAKRKSSAYEEYADIIIKENGAQIEIIK